MKRYTTSQLVAANVRPLCFVALCTAVGFLFGSALIGLSVGVIVIALVTLFL